MSALEKISSSGDPADISAEVVVAGAPIADLIRQVDPSLMSELAPHLMNEMLSSLRVSRCSVDELDFVARSLVSGLNDLDEMRETIRKQKPAPIGLAPADDY